MMNLRDIRLSKRLTQTDLANLVGITPAYYSMLEAGRRQQSPEIAKSIANILGFKNEWRALRGKEKSMETYDFDAFYMDVIDRLLDISQAKVAFSPNTNPEDTREWKELDKVRETLEYIEDRELYSAGIKYKADVMEFVTSRVGTVNFANLVAFFKTNRSRILNVIYQKDCSLAAPKRKAV